MKPIFWHETHVFIKITFKPSVLARPMFWNRIFFRFSNPSGKCDAEKTRDGAGRGPWKRLPIIFFSRAVFFSVAEKIIGRWSFFRSKLAIPAFWLVQSKFSVAEFFFGRTWTEAFTLVIIFSFFVFYNLTAQNNMSNIFDSQLSDMLKRKMFLIHMSEK